MNEANSTLRGDLSQEQNQNETSSNENVNLNAQESQRSVDELKKKVQELEDQLKDKESKYIYLYAEFENFKKRSFKERSDLVKFGWESVARDLLQTVDNLERALAHIPSQTDKVLSDGLTMILNEFKSTMQRQGVQAVESLGKLFDPHLHEAVAQEKADLPAGTILKEHLRGYTLHGRLLRPARVTVSQEQSDSVE